MNVISRVIVPWLGVHGYRWLGAAVRRDGAAVEGGKAVLA